jgi:hypothetical protein
MMRNVRTRFKASDKSVLKNHGGSDISSFNQGYQRRLIFSDLRWAPVETSLIKVTVTM